MEFFTCPCPGNGRVLVDGNLQGDNKEGSGNNRTLQCGRGLHQIALECVHGKKCADSPQTVMISETNPISPQEVPFQCEF